MANTQPTSTQLNSNQLESTLNSFLNKSLDYLFKPIGKNRFKYKEYSISKNNDQWIIIKNDKIISEAFLKISAFAITKAHERREKSLVNHIENFDYIFERNYLDSIFFKYTIDNSPNDDIKFTAIIRLEEANIKLKQAKSEIDKAFYSSLNAIQDKYGMIPNKG